MNRSGAKSTNVRKRFWTLHGLNMLFLFLEISIRKDETKLSGKIKRSNWQENTFV